MRAMGAATCAAVLQPLPISHHFHGCTALLVLRFVVVKWGYIKYLALPFFFYPEKKRKCSCNILQTCSWWMMNCYLVTDVCRTVKASRWSLLLRYTAIYISAWSARHAVVVACFRSNCERSCRSGMLAATSHVTNRHCSCHVCDQIRQTTPVRVSRCDRSQTVPSIWSSVL